MTTGSILIVGPGLVGRALSQAIGETGVPVAMKSRQVVTPDVNGVGQVWFTVKAFDLEEAFAQVLPKLAAGTAVVVTCNGLLLPEIRQVKAKFPDLAFVRGIVTFGVTERDGVLHRVGLAGRCYLGVYEGEMPKAVGDVVKTAVTKGPAIFEIVSDIARRERDKWILNTVINSLTAAKRLTRNGDLVLLGDLTDIVFTEACRIARRLSPDEPLSRDEVRGRLTDLIIDTADNENSMARDVRLGRKTEAAFFSGKADPETEPVLFGLGLEIAARN